MAVLILFICRNRAEDRNYGRNAGADKVIAAASVLAVMKLVRINW